MGATCWKTVEDDIISVEKNLPAIVETVNKDITIANNAIVNTSNAIATITTNLTNTIGQIEQVVQKTGSNVVNAVNTIEKNTQTVQANAQQQTSVTVTATKSA